MSKKLYFISLGCAKNQVDSEIMLYQLQSRGYALTSEPDEAEVVVINTCSFIESATQESIETILEAARLKEEGDCRILVVAGCFPQRYKKQLAAQMPEVDLFIGTEAFLSIADKVEDLWAGKKRAKTILTSDQRLWHEPRRRLLTTSPGSAYLKIAEGCSNRCAYCTIPSIRGPFRSREPLVLLEEARMLAADGVREIILVAQDITSYGTDLGPPSSLTDLIKSLLPVESLQWLRLLYLRPERITTDLLDLISREEKICPYLDIPIQHVSDRILKAMNRPYRQKDLGLLMETIRRALPSVALRTTVMVGFPGEGEEDFKTLLRFIAETEFDHLGVFSYSPEEGTPAAGYADAVNPAVSQARMDQIMALQKEITWKKNQGRIGSMEPVLVTGVSPESDFLIQGRTRFQAPEVDGVIYLTDGRPKIGEIVRVKITEGHPYDLVGVVV
jgi:ribosomal protein S12 methylthiotransferase